MNAIKRYFDCYIPITTCNLRCSYCYVAQQNLFRAQSFNIGHTPQEIRSALSVKRLDGVCLINLCAGGETLLYEDTIDIARELVLEGHYVMIVSNGLITKRFEYIASLPENVRKRLFIKFSFHYLELKRLDKFSAFFKNVNLMKKAKVSFTVELTPCDDEIPYMDDIKQKCIENLDGALCHVTIARSDIDPEQKIPHLSELTFDEYKEVWNTFDSELFRTKTQLFYQPRREFCYAGDWSAYVNLQTGELKQCYSGKTLCNIYSDRTLKFEAIGTKCEVAHCYNGHSFLVLGDIPELKLKSYYDLRNRVCSDGSEWIQPEMKKAFTSKLYETNKEYSKLKKFLIERKIR